MHKVFATSLMNLNLKIIAITETWCNEIVIDSEIHLDNL